MRDTNIPGKRDMRVDPALALMFTVPGFKTMNMNTTIINTVVAMGA